ncbi:MAG: carboxypeptidase regulatory-like domain-containing protein [Acidobacteria bacterium]|nr:carboxypeptidase regulatory-like domain-containing protein [Acidobacteriota bacterium]
MFHSLFVVSLLFAVTPLQGRNEIYGTVFVNSRQPVPDVYVELLDSFNSTLRQAKTDASGRFTFTGLSDGRYIVRVRPFGTDYAEVSQEVVLTSPTSGRGSGSDLQHIDIYLRRDERAESRIPQPGPSVVFVQDIPPSAKKLYEQAVKDLHDKKEREAFENLKKALEIFPDYHLALDRLGREYAVRSAGQLAYLQAALVLLTKAVEVNPESFTSVFALGWVQYQFGLTADAIGNLRRATVLNTRAADAHLWLGKAFIRGSKPNDAEAAFKRANELSSGKASEVHRQLAALYIDQKRYDNAADELEFVLKTDDKAEDAPKIRELIKQLREKGE